MPRGFRICLVALLAVPACLATPQEHARGRNHWSYRAPTEPEIPTVQANEWPINAIDRFTLARLEKEGLSPSPAAERARLLRRVSLDLTGLPPTLKEIDAFLNNSSEDAYEETVDRLLGSPRFGERWARPWLDLARYADSNGFQADQLRDSWAYRDWVIQALNGDMPFDRFTIEQIAGDLLPGATADQRIATGFHRTPTCNVEAGVDPEENRTNQVIDRINTTATVWLGTTMACAQCHDHKYDPITQKDYYRLLAYFNNTPLEVKLKGGKGVTWDFYGPRMDLPLSAAKAERRRELQKRLDQLQAKLHSESGPLLADWERRMKAELDRSAAWKPLETVSFKATGGESHSILKDGSILIGGKAPGTTTYEVVIKTSLTGITAFRVEALTHPSLPGTGPGRGDKKRTNFILSEFEVTRLTPEGGGLPRQKAIQFHSARADYSQKKWEVAKAIDGNRKTGWAIGPQFGKPHWAAFLTEESLGDGRPMELRVTLRQLYGRGRTLGRVRISAWTGDPAAIDLPDNIVAIVRSEGRRTASQTKNLKAYLKDRSPSAGKTRSEMARIRKEIDSMKGPTTLVMEEMKTPRMNAIFVRGNFLDKGDPVTPGVPAALHPVRKGLPGNRLGLARWLIDPSNPLVARVTVNRWWAELFGRGIVRTVGDFGTRGEAPTHPALLDWLAVRFVKGGWRMKPILKLIVTSATYRQSSRVPPLLLERDPENRLYARGPRIRMTAEMVRDNALAISGLLSTRMEGPPVFPPQPDGLWRHVGRNAPKYKAATGEDRFRRGVYVVWRRGAPYASFVNFDAPDRAACVPARPRTNTPLQALTLMNDEAYVEMALAFASRVLGNLPRASVPERVEYAFRSTLARKPTDRESRILEEVYRRERARFEADAPAATTLVRGIKGWTPPKNVDAKDLASWFFVTTILLNLDETITKG